MSDEELFIKRIAGYIKRHRELQGLTRLELGLRAGIDGATVCRIEKGKCNARAYSVYKILKALRDGERKAKR